MNLKDIKGFSLIELLVVIAIMSIIGTMALNLVTTGGSLYSSGYANQTAQKNARIAMSYITMRIRQNDTAGGIQVVKSSIPNEDILNILDSSGKNVMYSFSYDGDSKTLAENSQPIDGVNISGISFNEVGASNESEGVEITITDTANNNLDSTISLRSD